MATRDIVIRFLGEASGLNNAASQGSASVSRFSDRTQKVAKAAMVGVAAAGAAAVAFIKGGVEGIREGEEAEAKFAQVMRNVSKTVGISAEAVKTHAEAIQQNTRFSYEDALATSSMLAANDGLQQAIKAGVGTIEGLTDVTLDLATVQGVDGPAAAKLLAKWMAAPEKASAGLLKAGVKLTQSEKDQVKAWVASGDTAKAQGLILDKLKAKTEGAAKAAGETTAGQMARAQAAFGEVQEALAAKLIPVLNRLMGWLLKVAKWAEANPGKMRVVVIVLGSLALVIGAVSVAITLWTSIVRTATAVQKVWNFVMRQHPLVRIITVLALLGLAFIAAYKKSETFRNVVKAAMNAIRNVTIDVIGFVVDKFLWYAETILYAASKAFGWVPGLGGKLKKAHAAIAQFRDDTAATLESMKTQVTITADTGSAMREIAMLKRAVDGLGTSAASGVDYTSTGGAVQGRHGGMRAAGGPVIRGRSYVVGERGPEMFTPRSSGHVTPNHELGGNLTVEIHATGPTLADIVRIELRDAHRALVRTARAGGMRTA